MESAAIVDVIARRGLATADQCAHVRALYVRVVQMLTKLDAALAAAPHPSLSAKGRGVARRWTPHPTLSPEGGEGWLDDGRYLVTFTCTAQAEPPNGNG